MFLNILPALAISTPSAANDVLGNVVSYKEFMDVIFGKWFMFFVMDNE